MHFDLLMIHVCVFRFLYKNDITITAIILNNIYNRSQTSNIIKLFQLWWKTIFKQYGVCPKLDRLQRHGLVKFGKLVDALRPLHHVGDVGRQHFRVETLGTLQQQCRQVRLLFQESISGYAFVNNFELQVFDLQLLNYKYLTLSSDL